MRQGLGKTPQFRKLIQSLRYANAIQRKPEAKNAILEAIDSRTRGFGSDISRRRFVGDMLKAGIIISLPSIPLRKAYATLNQGQKVPTNGDKVLIVGAGFGGLATAYYLAKKGIASEIYEAQNRLGGRVMTKQNFNDEGMFVELGAELVDTGHEDLINLCNELGVPVQSIIDDDKNVESAVYYFGGRWYTDKDLIPAFGDLAARITKDKDSIYIDDENVDEAQLARFDKMSIEQYLRLGSDTDKWIRDMLLVAYTNEYGLPAEEQSAVNFLGYLDPDTSEGFLKIFGESDECKRIKGGNSLLTEALERDLTSRGVVINKNHVLSKIRQEGTGQIELSFTLRTQTMAVKSSQVVMAIPFTILRSVDGVQTLGMSQEKTNCINEMGYGTNAKLMLGFTERYWRRTDTGVIPSNANIMTELQSQQFWETSRAQPGKSGILTNFMGGNWGKNFTKGNIPTTHADLDKMYPGKTVVGAISGFLDNKTAFSPWPTFQWTKGSYSCPKIGQASKLMKVAGEPELGKKLLFAGEHTSLNFGGFMNGALETGRLAAESIIESRHVAAPKKRTGTGKN